MINDDGKETFHDSIDTPFGEEIGEEYVTAREVQTNPESRESPTAGRTVGYIALALSILSLFTVPVLFGIGGVIVGVMARNRGARALGTWAIVIGTISTIGGIFLAPFS
ncbi:hypothetical protein [Fervidibacillus albus]|uniref:DUF4190 domain-containing protein n=1 Tax=Fervidibacillus albus TaxID=2980026 RepID=A0A9E8LVE2_9BACI|nr:hypothetical protein [Fervidibacillus albus]WAA10403.1 hypothetical protein OE104_03475 [Fervidibacillus albus]